MIKKKRKFILLLTCILFLLCNITGAFLMETTEEMESLSEEEQISRIENKMEEMHKEQKKAGILRHEARIEEKKQIVTDMTTESKHTRNLIRKSVVNKKTRDRKSMLVSKITSLVASIIILSASAIYFFRRQWLVKVKIPMIKSNPKLKRNVKTVRKEAIRLLEESLQIKNK
jgi:DNA-directed RNA polymerase beta subunit